MFNHGIAIAKNNILDLIKKGEKGIITAYLPEMEKFAIQFSGEGRWHTFTGTEEWFLNNFEIIEE